MQGVIAARVRALAAGPAFAGLQRSLAVYYGDGTRERAMDGLYARFLQPGDLAFDIGSHVGDRIASFRRLGARVVAAEPQPLCAQLLRALYGDDQAVTLVEAACGAREGTITLHINSANPTVSTASEAFIGAAAGDANWQGQVWDRAITVPVTTLDALIARHGVPRFVKIDVEGFEGDVLSGLTVALPQLSFEFTTIQRALAKACIGRLEELGRYRFQMALGESQHFTTAAPVSAGEMTRHLDLLPDAANSGDIYATLEPSQ